MSSPSDLTESLLPSLPFVAVLSTTLGLGLVKLTAYSQLEVVRTAMLSRHVKNGGATVLQLGGTTRDVYYYPSKTVKITVNEQGLNRGLFEQAGMTVGVPVEATNRTLEECLKSTPTASLDSVVSFEQFSAVTDPSHLKRILKEIARVLKPGGTFVFYERLQNGGPGQLFGAKGCGLPVGDIVSGAEYWDFCEYDVAAGGLDGHDVGVAIKRMDDGYEDGGYEDGGYEDGGYEGRETGGRDQGLGSVDGSAFEAMIRSQRRKAKKATKGKGESKAF